MALDKKLAAKLNKANKMWGKAKTRAATEKSGFEEIADGRYLARLTGAEINESKSSDRLQVAWTYKIVDGDYKGASKMDFDGLESEDNLMYLARKIAKYGYEAPDDLEEVEKLLTQIVGEKPLVKIRLKTKGGSDFQNVYLDNVIDPADEDDVLAESAADSEENADEAEETEAEEESSDDAEEETEEESDETEEESDDEAELQVGMTVNADWKGATVTGKVLEILADTQQVRLETTDGRKIRVGIDKLSAPSDAEETEETDEEEDVPESPVVAKKPAAASKKPAPAPAKKPVKK